MKKIFIAAALLTLASSCGKDFLNKTPIDQQTDVNYYKTPQDAFSALVATYSVLDWGDYGHIILTSEIASDDCFGGGGNTDGGWRQWDRFQNYTDLNAAAWTKYYTGIFRANTLLQKIANIDFGGNAALKNRYTAEARFLRAYFYFDLVRMFGNVPLLDAPLEPGQYDRPQANPDDVYKQIAQDLKFAAANIPATAYSAIPQSEYGRATKWAAESLLGRVFLYYTGYYSKSEITGEVTRQDARNAIEDVITNSGYGLVDKFPNLWQAAQASFVGEDNKETVFSIKYTWQGLGNWNSQNGNRWQVDIAIRNQTLPPYYKGWGAATVNPKLYNAYEAGDTRKGASIISIEDENLTAFSQGDQYQYTGYYWKKYTPIVGMLAEDKGGDFQIDNYYDYIAIRFADVLLMGAELNLDADLSKAQNYYNMIRDRAFQDIQHRKMLSGGSNGLQLIMQERRLELALEGMRYWDLLRQGIPVAKQAIDNSGMGADFDVSFRTETKGLLQIPQTQVSLSNGSLKQNPGW
ncbi:RagB/SusD family nutrient uptake outer membrane protein [Mucilaginibacter sp. Bleaf8]|uniref:RagB/SusD family nutrient uptake outer membrane protein n=1 Tax=Mucilaginibacter sp. Bleaf8 TaxID=2834430 RepID=UPI001BCE8D86|nr:RagB/SusD family nutrient uptake outer membrane protein [Mucilaginibacter sp. Bleaf8]MBS7563269.1 RagB/SusD family nutrient uptake outer membrane protein [Mucilaginibacter sp. Bleaf8]